MISSTAATRPAAAGRQESQRAFRLRRAFQFKQDRLRRDQFVPHDCDFPPLSRPLPHGLNAFTFQWSTNFAQWFELTNATRSVVGGKVELEDADAAGKARRFYRVLER